MSRGGEPSLAEQRERLAELRRRERELRALRERQVACRAECIAAGVALRRQGGEAPVPDAAAARGIEAALDRRRGLVARLARVHEGTREERDRLREARAALQLWLEAPRDGSREGAAGRMRKALLGAALLVVVAALSVHPVLLVLLVPVAGAGSFLSWSGQDRAWRRMGARRRFDATRLAGPKRWEAAPVQERLAAIEALIAQREAGAATGAGVAGSAVAGAGGGPGAGTGTGAGTRSAGEGGAGAGDGAAAGVDPGIGARNRPGSGAGPGGGAGVEDHPRTLQARVDAEDALLDALLAGAGMTRGDLDRGAERRIRELAGASRSRVELAGIEERIGELRRTIDTLREDLYRYLARRGAAPAAGGADSDTLAAGLEGLARGAARG